jgi:hypothetical protein
VKKLTDLDAFKDILPYASEIFGVYQPMLGWRSKRTMDRIVTAFAHDLDQVSRKFKGRFEAMLNEDGALQEIRIQPATPRPVRHPAQFSFVMDAIARDLPTLEEYDPAIWDGLLGEDRLRQTLERVVVPGVAEWHRKSLAEVRAGRMQEPQRTSILADQLERESGLAGYLQHLHANGLSDQLKQIFYKVDVQLMQALELLKFKDPLEAFDPFKDMDRVSLSPVGIVHLFRQYFYEFDTFLGTPVGHVWLSPGSTVELIEISTRRDLVERTFESTFETIVKQEKSTTEEDDISDAVREDNRNDFKFGASATANQSWVGGSASATASLDLGTTQTKAREETHRHMRQQTEKLSTEIRKNYRSTFKQTTEVTDTSSKRYTLTNTTDALINYELRRKMRQVGVQVQDIGTYLCWQTFVDDPGRQLGVAQLVHIAKDPDVGSVPPPEAIPVPQPIATQLPIDIPFVQKSEDRGDLDEGYRDGREVDEDFNEGDIERIQADFSGFVAVCDQSGYVCDHIDFDYQGNDVELSLLSPNKNEAGKVTFGVHLDYVNFRGNSPIRVIAKIAWVPIQSVIDDVTSKNKSKLDAFNEQTRLEFEKAFVSAARERIKLASNIEPRKYEELREEERIVVYRKLVQDMLTKGIPMPDDRTRHVVAELLNTIFDVDKMLYFVAPEWWRPRLHHSGQSLGGLRRPASVGSAPGTQPKTTDGTLYTQIKTDARKALITSTTVATKGEQVAPIDTVGWGGEHREDNYYITEESRPAKLGSSLGWLLQLDGDNLRNAFLNAPWVKAVIPIRPGKEGAAINWLQRVHVEGTEGLDDQYVAPAAELAAIPHAGAFVTIRDAINYLCDTVAQKHADSMKVGRYPTDEIHDDNKVSATPIDKVYEHGFYPLQGGFRTVPAAAFEVFDQWVEVLPTDQVVPVEVTYDPKTGRQL